jgi:hypothetical protein
LKFLIDTLNSTQDLSAASNDGPAAFDGSSPAQQTPWGGMQWVPPGPWPRPGLQQPARSSQGMPQTSGWVPWPQQPPRGGGGGDPSRRMISRRTSEFVDLAIFICIWTLVTFTGPL